MVDRRFILRSLLPTVLFWTLTGSQFAHSSVGMLDPSFNETGTWTGTPDGREAWGIDSLILPDGKIMVVGFALNTNYRSEGLVQRHLSDGRLDTSYGTNGRLILPASTSETSFRRVLLLPDGKILVLGWTRTDLDSFNSKVDVSALRLLSDGTPDNNFGPNGLNTISLFPKTTYVTDAELLPDGKILVSFWGDDPNLRGRAVGVCRLNADGTLDTDFADNGSAHYHFGLFNEVNSIALMSDGRIILAGMLYRNSQQIGMLVCLNADGSPDISVSADGAVYTHFGSGTGASFTKVVPLPDGRLLAGGIKTHSGSTRMLVASYREDMTLDPNFGSEGIASPTFPGDQDDGLADLSVTDSSQILVASSRSEVGTGDLSRFALARLKADGTVDTLFGEGGQIVTPIESWASSVSLTHVTGSQWLITGHAAGERMQVALARYLIGPTTVTVRNEVGGLLSTGDELVFKSVAAGYSSQQTLEVTNPGGEDLPTVSLVIEGTDFSISPATSDVPQGKTTYVLRFQPASSLGVRSGVLKVIKVGFETPLLEIQLQGRVYSANEDSDGDGLNDVTEFKLESFGFDPLVPQVQRVNSLFGNLGEAHANLNASGYYTASQIQEMHAGSLLERDNESGEMILRLHLEQSSDLTGFELMPLTESGISLTPEGRLEYRFAPAQGRAFYRLAKP